LDQLVASFNVSRLRFQHKAFKYDEDYGKAPKDKVQALLSKGASNAFISRAYGLHTNDMENIYVFYTIGTKSSRFSSADWPFYKINCRDLYCLCSPKVSCSP
jgi:hypothetical protein